MTVKAAEMTASRVRETYRFDVELYLVNRVYLARNIEQRHSKTSALGAQVRLVLNLRAAADAQAAIQKSLTTVPDAPGASKVGEPSPNLRQLVAEQQSRLSDLTNEAASGLPGGLVAVNSADSSRISLSQILQRPVAIGFRAIHKQLSNLDSAAR